MLCGQVPGALRAREIAGHGRGAGARRHERDDEPGTDAPQFPNTASGPHSYIERPLGATPSTQRAGTFNPRELGESGPVEIYARAI